MNPSPRRPAVLTADELSVFCTQLSLMLQAGIGSEESLGILADDAASQRERALLSQIHSVLCQGLPLAQALEQTGLFPPHLIHMVEIGQVSGRLDQVFSSLAAHYRREAQTTRSLRRAILYPAVMGVLIAVVFLALVSQVLPVFQQVFRQLGVNLSPVAQALLQFGQVSQTVSWVLAVVLLVCAAALLWLFRAQSGQSTLSRLLSHSAASRAVDRSRFASVMALMLSSGIPLDDAMDHACTLLSGSALAPALEQCRMGMLGGASFAKVTEDYGIFTGLQAGLLKAGFRAGASEQVMEELAQRCQSHADERLSAMLSRFEYILLAVLCLSIGLVLLSVMLPLLGVLTAIGG